MISKPVVILLLLLAGGLLAIACGSASPAQEAAESAVLRMNDFPPGWTSSSYEEPEDVGFSESCKRRESQGKVSKANSDQFTGPNDQVVSTAATVFLSEEASQDALNANVERASRCRAEMQAAFTKLFSDQGVDSTVAIEDLSFPNLGDSSTAVRIVVELQTNPPHMSVSDTVNLVTGKMAGTFVYTSTGTPDHDEVLALAAAFASKLNVAKETLPE